MENMLLTAEEIEKLSDGMSVDSKLQVYKKISQYYNTNQLSEKEKQTAKDLMKKIVSDKASALAVLEDGDTKIDEELYLLILDKYGDEEVRKKIVMRKKLPTIVVEKLIDGLPMDFREKMFFNHIISNNMSSKKIDIFKDQIVVGLAKGYSDTKVEELVSMLYKLGKLSPELIVKSVSEGELKFFESALSVLTKRKIADIRQVLSNDNGCEKIKVLMKEAGVPEHKIEEILSVLKIMQDMRFNLQGDNRETFTQKVKESFLIFDSECEKNDISDI